MIEYGYCKYNEKSYLFKKYLKNNKVFTFLLKYWQIICVSFVFLGYQLFISFTLWNRVGNIPPGFGDSLGYIFGVNKVIKYHNPFPPIPYFGNYALQPAHFSYIGYNLILGLFGIIFKTTGYQLFFYSFFVGKLILLFSCIYLLKNLFNNTRSLLAFSLLCLGMFVGDGSTHGFFWVAPSFWMLVVFFFLIGIINSTKKIKPFLVFFLCLFYITIHPLSIFSTFIFAIYSFFLFLFTKHIPKNAITILALLIISAIFWQMFIFGVSSLNKHTRTPVPIPSQKTLPQVIKEIKEDSNRAQTNSILYVVGIKQDDIVQQVSNSAPSLPQVRIFDELLRRSSETSPPLGTSIIPAWNGYFSWFFRLPFLLVLLLGGIFLSIKKERWNLISLYLSCLSFTLISLINPMGYRSILFLFPVTIIFLATTLYDLTIYLNRNKNKLINMISFFLYPIIIVGLAGYALFGFKSVKYYSTIADYKIDPSRCVNYIKKLKPQETKIYFTSVEGINYFLNQGIDQYYISGINNFDDKKRLNNTLLITDDYTKIKPSEIDIPLTDTKQILPKIKENIDQATHVDCSIFQLFDITQILPK